MTPDETHLLDQSTCTYLVTGFLLAQEWQLADPAELAARIWEELSADPPCGVQAQKKVQRAVVSRYAALLHARCRQGEMEGHERAWLELRQWLGRRAWNVMHDYGQREDVLQETLLSLHEALEQRPLSAPHTFLAYALQVMKRTNIDHYRRRTAAKRGQDLTLSLEAVHNSGGAGETRRWHETRQPLNRHERKTESTVSQTETRQQLKSFFREHLSSDLQRQVAEAHFLDGLTPAEIGQLMGKKAHEIRMAKARALANLRELSPGAREQLTEILKAGEWEDNPNE